MANERLGYGLEDNNQYPSKSVGSHFNERRYEDGLSGIAAKKKASQQENDIKIGELMRELFGHNSTDIIENNEAWEKIEGYLRILQNDAQLVDTFENVPPDVQTLYGESYKGFIINQFNSENESSDEEKCKSAALLLTIFERGASPYRNLAGYENNGLWVKVLLGNAHYNHFLEDKQNCINELKDDREERDKIQDALATCEMDYIINNIRGNKGKFKYFGYDPSKGKVSLPSQFADRLSSLSEGRLNRASVEERYEKIVYTDFDIAKNDFERFITSGRIPKALGNLKQMIALANTDDNKIAEAKKYFLICMLSGVLDIRGTKNIREQVYEWGTTIGFLPSMLVKNTGHSEQVVALLDDFSDGDFSRHVTSVFHGKDLLKGGINIGDLINEIDSWWSVDMMHKFDQYCKSDFLTKKFSFGSPLWRLQKLASRDSVDADSILRS